jgi:hypothetical protein
MDDQIISRFANIGQILGLKNVKSAFAVLTLGSIWQTGTWFFGSNVRIDLGQWWLAVAALCFLVYLWLILRPENLIRNPRFAEGTRYWGSGYLEDEVRDGVHSAEIARLPYVVHPDSSKTESSGEPGLAMSMRLKRSTAGRKRWSVNLRYCAGSQGTGRVS